MAAADSLAAWGILRAPDVVEIAAGAGLELAAAAAMLEKESSGGRNIWGRDGVETAGTYTKGGDVTPANYAAYIAAVRAGRAGRQGCGPTQLTYYALQDQADRLGGCWDWRINVTVGFRHLASLIKSYGTRDGFRRYNGAGPAAEAYADDAMARRQKWIDRLGSARPSPPAPTTPGGDWFDMATLDDLRNVVREVCGTPAQRGDIGWTRDQLAAVLDFNPKLSPSELAADPQSLGLLQDIAAIVSARIGGAAQIDYRALAKALVVELLEASSGHPTDPEAPTGTPPAPV